MTRHSLDNQTDSILDRLGQNGTVLEVGPSQKTRHEKKTVDKYLVKFSGQDPDWFFGVQLAPADPVAKEKDEQHLTL